jgi:hypothetical protein
MSSRKLLTKYEDWISQALEEHVNKGWSVASFRGVYPISERVFSEWKREQPALRAVVDKYNKRKMWRYSMIGKSSREERK